MFVVVEIDSEAIPIFVHGPFDSKENAKEIAVKIAKDNKMSKKVIDRDILNSNEMIPGVYFKGDTMNNPEGVWIVELTKN